MASTLSAADMDAAIIGYLPFLEKEQKAAVLGIIQAFAPVPDAGDHWDDPSFVAEMDQRRADYEAGRNVSSFSNVASAMDYLTTVKKE